MKSKKLDNIKKMYPLCEEKDKIDFNALAGDKLESFQAEMSYIKKVVEVKMHVMREKKTDKELLEDVRFFNRHSDYLFNLMKQRDNYQRLGIAEADKASLTKAKVKKAYHKMALLWHPDSINKTHKYCFAHEAAYINLVSQSFQLVEESYRQLSI